MRLDGGRRPTGVLDQAIATEEAVVAQLDAYRRRLTAHCYRMLGSAFDADDAVQETMVRAWRGVAGFERRGELEAWLFRIATNVCLNHLRGRGRRALPMDLGPASSPDVAVPDPSPRAWIGPVPDARVLDPLATVVERDSLRLAFVAALQRLPPRQRAVLLLRDVLGWRTHEVAALLDVSDTAVKSALQRARATMSDAAPPDAALDERSVDLLARYVDAFERYDVDALVALLHDDAVMSMPPIDLWLQGAADLRRWWSRESHVCRHSLLRPVAANGSPAVAHVRILPDGTCAPFAIQVLSVADGRIAAVHAFLQPELFALFGPTGPDEIPQPIG